MSFLIVNALFSIAFSAVVCKPKTGPLCSTRGRLFRDDCKLRLAGQTKSRLYRISSSNTCICKSNVAVCATTGTTVYKNNCAIEKAGLQVATGNRAILNGACTYCNQLSGPLCSTDNLYYDNECALTTAGKTASNQVPVNGECPQKPCNVDSGKVCDSEMNLWTNECELQNQGHILAPDATIINERCCPNTINGVCSTEGTYYINYCQMEAYGKTIATNYVADDSTNTCISGDNGNTSFRKRAVYYQRGSQ